MQLFRKPRSIDPRGSSSLSIGRSHRHDLHLLVERCLSFLQRFVALAVLLSMQRRDWGL